MAIYKFKKGKKYHLDEVYEILGTIPTDTYLQDDISDSTWTNENDSGESVTFVKDVTIKIEVEVSP